MPHVACPQSFSAMTGLGLELSQRENWPFLQWKQSPQLMTEGTTTRSPGMRFFTLLPTSTTSPMNSWPRMSPLSTEGM
jgi:hypothetical protein